MKQIAKILERDVSILDQICRSRGEKIVHILDIFLKAGIAHRLDVKSERNLEVKDVFIGIHLSKMIKLSFTKWRANWRASLRGVVEETLKAYYEYSKFENSTKHKSGDVKYVVDIQVRVQEKRHKFESHQHVYVCVRIRMCMYSCRYRYMYMYTYIYIVCKLLE